MEGRPPKMEGSCEYIEQTSAKKRGVVLQFGMWTWTDYLDKRPKRKNMDVRSGTWNIRNCIGRAP
jgi:hypothetical protein